MALLGVGTAAATALIVACGSDKTSSNAPVTSSAAATSPSVPPGSAKALPTAPITWAGPQGQLQGAWAQSPKPRGGILVIHENRGLNDWVRSVAGRFAGIGYSALAIDLLSEHGGTGKFTDPAQATGALSKIPPQQFVADMTSGIGELAHRVPGKKLAVVGFCMGGGLVWQLLAAGAPQLAAAFPFYGPAPEHPDFKGSKDVAVLAFYGEQDKRVTSTAPIVEAAMEKAGIVHKMVTEPSANHAFFNDTGDRYNAVAADDAWRQVQDWLTQYVG
ncbi:MAG: dienelactone hydrolase family protein [Mycobacterium sp.]